MTKDFDHPRPPGRPPYTEIDGSIRDAERDVLTERREQVRQGHSADNDDKLIAGELAQAGALYALFSTMFQLQRYRWEVVREWFPKAGAWVYVNKSPRRALVVAAALLIAEIERIDRRDARSEIVARVPDYAPPAAPTRSRLSWPQIKALRRFIGGKRAVS